MKVYVIGGSKHEVASICETLVQGDRCIRSLSRRRREIGGHPWGVTGVPGGLVVMLGVSSAKRWNMLMEPLVTGDGAESRGHVIHVVATSHPITPTPRETHLILTPSRHSRTAQNILAHKLMCHQLFWLCVGLFLVLGPGHMQHMDTGQLLSQWGKGENATQRKVGIIDSSGM